MSQTLVLNKNASETVKKWINSKTIGGDIENWEHNVKKDYFGQAARNMQALIVKLARTLEESIDYPKTKDIKHVLCYDFKSHQYREKKINISYLEHALKYILMYVLLEKITKKYYVLYTFDSKFEIKNNLNTEANYSKHSLVESRFCARTCSKVYNEIVEKIVEKTKIKAFSKFKVNENNIKNDNIPTSNYFYLKPIKGDPEYEIKFKKQNFLFELFKKTLVTPDDYYIQMKAIKYQRDVVLKEEMDNKWKDIRKDRCDHSLEMKYIADSIGDHTFKIDFIINQLIYNKIDSPKALNLGLKYINEELERNCKIIDYTEYVINGVDTGKWGLISSNGIEHTNTKILLNYIEHKKTQNNKLIENKNKIISIQKINNI